MLKTLILAGLAGFAGYQLGNYLGAKREIPTQRDGAPLGRMARDIRLMCQDMDPTLRYIEGMYADQRVTPQELLGLTRRLEQLV